MTSRDELTQLWSMLVLGVFVKRACFACHYRRVYADSLAAPHGVMLPDVRGKNYVRLILKKNPTFRKISISFKPKWLHYIMTNT